MLCVNEPFCRGQLLFFLYITTASTVEDPRVSYLESETHNGGAKKEKLAKAEFYVSSTAFSFSTGWNAAVTLGGGRGS